MSTVGASTFLVFSVCLACTFSLPHKLWEECPPTPTYSPPPWTPSSSFFHTQTKTRFASVWRRCVFVHVLIWNDPLLFCLTEWLRDERVWASAERQSRCHLSVYRPEHRQHCSSHTEQHQVGCAGGGLFLLLMSTKHLDRYWLCRGYIAVEKEREREGEQTSRHI